MGLLEEKADGDDAEHMEGYRDGRNPDTPEPSANRSWCYRHSFTIGRMEIAGKPVVAEAARRSAELASAKDVAL